jgi:hypothetical protein
MADANSVMLELNNNGDLVVVYDGAQGLFPEGGRRTGSLRYSIFKLVWDFLRFQKPGDFLGWKFDPNTPVGMRDVVSRQYVLAVQNNAMLRALCQANKIDVSKLPGFPSDGGQS